MKNNTNQSNNVAKRTADVSLTELEERVDILSERYDKARLVIDNSFSHPIRFALSRLYYRFIKKDEICE